jgi:hypothetical protein
VAGRALQCDSREQNPGFTVAGCESTAQASQHCDHWRVVRQHIALQLLDAMSHGMAGQFGQHPPTQALALPPVIHGNGEFCAAGVQPHVAGVCDEAWIIVVCGRWLRDDRDMLVMVNVGQLPQQIGGQRPESVVESSIARSRRRVHHKRLLAPAVLLKYGTRTNTPRAGL